MTRRYTLSAGQLVLLSSILALLPAAAFGAYAMYSLIARDQTAQREQLLDTARALMGGFDRELQAQRQITAILAGSRLLAINNIAAFDDLARDSARAGRYDVVLVDRSGQQLVNTRIEAGRPLPQSQNQDLIEDTFRTGTTKVSNLVRRTSDGTYTVAILTPVTATGDRRYVLIVMPHLDSLAEVFDRIPLAEEWAAALDDPSHTIIARTVDPGRFVGTKARLQTPNGGSGIQYLDDLDGRSSLVAYQVSARTGFRAVVWAPETAFYASSNTLKAWLGIIALIVLLVTGATALIAARLVRKPMLDLVMTARRVATGEPVEHHASIMSEANIVGQALEQASQAISLRETALRKETAKTVELARELAHRTKNVMAVVSAIARQSLRSAKDVQDFASIFEGRLGGLARSLDLLVETDWEGVSLDALVTQQLSSFADAGRFDAQGPPVLLAPPAVQNIGMALHELATNAMKHGALSVPQGGIRIRWALQAGQFTLAWEEHDGPATCAPVRKGFGRSVIEEIAANSLAGSAALAFEPEGIRWSLTAPIASVVANARQP